MSKKKLINKFDGGGNTNSRITRQDYLQSKADEVRNKAIEYSYSREMPTAYYNDGYVQTYNAKTGLWEEVPGINYNDSCLYTYTDSYSQDGINRRVPGNQTLYADPLKYGFKPIEKSEVQKGDLVQATDSEGIPRHAMLYTGTNYLGNPIFNYSAGDVYGTYKKDNPYKVDDTDLYYTFVGTPEDQHRWTLEYIDKHIKPNIKSVGLTEGINEYLNNTQQELPSTINFEIPVIRK